MSHARAASGWLWRNVVHDCVDRPQVIPRIAGGRDPTGPQFQTNYDKKPQPPVVFGNSVERRGLGEARPATKGRSDYGIAKLAPRFRLSTSEASALVLPLRYPGGYVRFREG
jgi:hypothetical protein